MQTKEYLNRLNRERVRRFREANPLSNRDSYLKARDRILLQKKEAYKKRKTLINENS